MADASWDIVVGVQNKQEIDALNDSIEKGEEAIRRHTAVLQMQGAAVQQGDPVFKQYGDSIAAATERVKELTEANARLAAGVGKGIPGSYGVASSTYDVGDIRGRTQFDGEVEAAVEATRARKILSQAVDEEAAHTEAAAAATRAADSAKRESSQTYAQLTARSKELGVALKALHADFRAGAINVGQFQERTKQLSSELARTQGALKGGGSQAFGGGAAMGLLQLGQAVDDVQYGFRAIVNNIPSIVMGFGGGAGIAGAVGIAAVAVNQLINHWGELKATFGDTQFFRDAAAAMREFEKNGGGGPLGKGGGAVERDAAPDELPGGLGAIGKLMKWWEGKAPARALAAAHAADEEAGAKLFAKAGDAEVNKQKAADFQKAIEESGGLKAVLDRTLKEAMKAFDADKSDEKDRAAFEAEQKGRIAKLFAEGMKGGDFNPDAFGADFGKQFDAQEKHRKEKEAEKESKEKADADKAMDRERTKLLNEQGRLQEDRMWADREDEIEGLQDREKKIQRRKQDEGGHESKIFSGGKAIADSLLTSGMNHVAQAQLQEARNLNRKIDALRQDLKNDRKQARLGQ